MIFAKQGFPVVDSGARPVAEFQFSGVKALLDLCQGTILVGSSRHREAAITRTQEKIGMLKRFLMMTNRLETAYRRINHPEIRRGDLVLDVGGGGSPYPGAHVVCDYFSDDLERADSLRIDRPFVWAAAEMLPFKDKAFDYSIASHILEHVEDPSSVLDELSRVSRAGYIETPSAFYEFAVPHPYHVSRCSVIDGRFTVVMKDAWNQQLDLRYFDLQSELLAKWRRLAELDTLAVLTIYKWRDYIEFDIHGSCAIEKSAQLMESVQINMRRSFLRKLIIKLLYLLMRPRPDVELSQVLACPLCHGEIELHGEYQAATCHTCEVNYPSYKGYLDFRLKAKGAGARASGIVQS